MSVFAVTELSPYLRKQLTGNTLTLTGKGQQYQKTTDNKRHIKGVSITQHKEPVSGRGVLG